MTTQRTQDHPPDPTIQRRRILLLAAAVSVLALLHFIDHAIRGSNVVQRALNPDWNHSGWPFDDHTDKPFIYPISFVVIFVVLLGGIVLTRRGRVWAGYWLVTSTVLVAFLLFIHFVGFSPGAAETPSVIAGSYSNVVASIAALIVFAGLIAVLILLAVQAVRSRQRSGHW